MKAKLLGLLPGVRWVPHDIPSQTQSKPKAKPKSRSSRIRFSLKSSSDSTTLQPRKSTISLRSEPNAEIDARTHAQGQSMFFAMLPLEIRRMVYEYVMGEETVHLTFSAKKRFGHFLCERHNQEELEDRDCGCRVLVGGRESEKLSGACVKMLRTCRRLYSEAIAHLYRPHTFSLLHITHLLYLPTSIPQPRLDSIRTLNLRWAIRALPYLYRGNKLAYREDTTNWEKGWRILADMQGLRDLYVLLIDPSPQGLWESNWVELEGKLLEPVKSVTKPRWFELVLPYSSCNAGWNMGDSMVVLRKPEGDVMEDEDE